MSCSGSETSTDISTSSLENLSTSARQEPQGEETADLTSGLLDEPPGDDVSATTFSSGADDVDAKSWLQSGIDVTNLFYILKVFFYFVNFLIFQKTFIENSTTENFEKHALLKLQKRITGNKPYFVLV